MVNIINISDARTKLPDLVDKTSGGLVRYLITVNSKPKAVLISVDELDSLEETAEILSEPGALESIRKSKKQIRKGQYISFSDLKKKYKID